MSNYIIDKISSIKRLDADIEKQKNAKASKLSDMESSINNTKNSGFVNDCVRYISDFYQSAEKTVKTICDLQDGVNIGSEYKLKTYLNVSPLSFRDQDFINVYEKVSRDFSINIKSILSAKTIQQLTDKKVPDYMSNLAVAYATIKNINERSRKLANDYATPHIDEEVKKLRDEMNKYTTETDAAIDKAVKELKTALAELEKDIAEEERRLAMSVISNTDKMEENFSSKFTLCIGKSTPKDQSYNISSKALNYNKTFNISTLSHVCGYEEHKNNNIKFNITNFDEQLAYRFAENLIMKFLLSYPAQFKKVVSLHNQAGSGLLSVMSQTYNCGTKSDFALEKGMSAVANDEGTIENVLKLLDDRVNDVCERLGISGHSDVYSYNTKHPDTAEPIILLVIKDFPSGLTRSRSLELFERVYEQGNKAGIITLVMWDKNKVKMNYGEEARALEMISALPSAYNLVGQKDGTILYGDSTLTPLSRKSDFNVQKFFENISKELNLQNKPIDFFSIQDTEDFAASPRRKAFSESLVIPVGKLSGKVMSLTLSSSDKAHVVVNGGTGSGKTAFLHTLILSAANNYSPDELEINLFDFKDGVGFKMYQEEKTRLPHVNFIALENKIEDAQEVLEYINSLMTKRNKLISSIPGVNSLKGYNDYIAKHPDKDKPKIPRSLIIIDEYQFLLMNDKCVSVLENIARQGRSAGMSLVLVSQDVPNESGFSKIKLLLDHRFAFRGSNENIDRLIPGTGRRSKELELQKGLCFYEANDSVIKSMRVAFSGDDKTLAHNISKIASKYTGQERELHIVGAPKPYIIDDFSKVSILPADQLRRDYIEKGVCNLVLGKYCLTEEPVHYVSSEDNTLLAVVGSYIKSKQVITSIVCSQLITLSKVKESEGKIILIDLCEQRRLVNIDTSLNQLIRKKAELEDEGDETTLSALHFYDSDGFADAITHLYDIYKNRCEDKNAALDPIEVILIGTNHFDVNDRNARDTFEWLKEMIQNGKKCDIYFTIQADSLDSAFAKNVLFQRMGTNILKDLIILPDDTSDSSLGVRNTLAAISSLIGSKTSSEYMKSLEKNPLDPSLCFIVDDGMISKYSYFQYEGDWINSFLKHLR